MTVAQLIAALLQLPAEAVVLLESGDGLSAVGGCDFVPAQGPGAPAEVIPSPSLDE